MELGCQILPSQVPRGTASPWRGSGSDLPFSQVTPVVRNTRTFRHSSGGSQWLGCSPKKNKPKIFVAEKSLLSGESLPGRDKVDVGLVPSPEKQLPVPCVTPRPPAKHVALLLGQGLGWLSESLSSAHLRAKDTASQLGTCGPREHSRIEVHCALRSQEFVCMEIFPPVPLVSLHPLVTEQVTARALIVPIIQTGKKGLKYGCWPLASITHSAQIEIFQNNDSEVAQPRRTEPPPLKPTVTRQPS